MDIYLGPREKLYKTLNMQDGPEKGYILVAHDTYLIHIYYNSLTAECSSVV